MLHPSRLSALLARLEAGRLDALLVTSLVNIRYLTGFTGTTALLLVSPARTWFITDFRYHGRVQGEVGAGVELVDNSFKDLARDVLPALEGTAGLKRIGFEAEYASFAAHERWAQGAPERQFIPTRGWIEALRMVKDADELARLGAAERLGERIFSEILAQIGPQTTEADLAAEFECRLRRYGASAASFSPIIASGARSDTPHAGYSAACLVPGAPLTIDVGVVLDGYCSDMTRTVFYRDCPADWARVYNIVREAQQVGFAALAPGVRGCDADAAARDYITAQGYGEQFGHGLGHGVGLQIHEDPRLAPAWTGALQAGHVTSCEPGIYLPGQGGVRIENLVYITPTGAQAFNELGTELTVVG